MSVIVNKNTSQDPILTGQTGAQVIRFIDAPRVYIKAVDTTPTPPTTKSNGTTPAGYTDLGIVDGKAKISYTKDMQEVRTGLDNVLRAVYVDKKTGTFTFNLTQLDDVTITQLSGLTASVVTSGSVVQWSVGSEDVIQKALLIVLQNKLDGKELQFYHPNAYMSFQFTSSNDYTVIECDANLPLFTYNSVSTLFVLSDFA